MSRTEELRKSWTEDLIRRAASNLIELNKKPTYDEAEAFVRSVITAHTKIIEDLPKK